jgi:hypothetical protein
MLLIGSKALAHYNPLVKPNDTDIVCFSAELPTVADLFQGTLFKETEYVTTFKSEHGFIECMIADHSPALQGYLDFEGVTPFRYSVASPATLYSLKKSHIHFPTKFDKHIEDYCWLHKKVNGVDKLESVTKLHFAETEIRLGKLKTPSLNKSVSAFFGQSDKFVKSWFVHDDIHKVMAHKDKPLYEYMQRDPNLAKCDKDLWEAFTFEEKCQCVLEEAYVIALERKIIPFVFGEGTYLSGEQALRWSLMRVCTTLTGGWFREFATNNYMEIWELANKEYDIKFLSKVEQGDIKLIA